MRRRILIAATVIVMIASAALALYDQIRWPEATDLVVQRDSKLTVDMSNVNDGYIMVKGDANKNGYKLRVAYNKNTLTYDLNNLGEYEIIPLQFGNGKYTLSLYASSGGKKYSTAGTVKMTAEFTNENVFALVPNQYVDYNIETTAVAMSDEICELANAQTDQEKFEAIRAYIMENYEYDWNKARKVKAGTMPDIEYCMENHMGICQDLSAMAACMLRVQGIETKFVIGYAGKQYHAWNVVLIDGEEILYDATADLGGISKGKYKVERYY